MELNRRELDLHRLELRFAATRVANPRSLFSLRLGRRLAQDTPHRITRQVEQPADLAQAVALRFQDVHARTDFRLNHVRLTG
jgi:hypothetical protein